MKKTDIFPSNYIKAADIGNREVTVVISHVAMEKLGEDNKLVVYFQGKEKGMVCNMTNFDRIAYCYGDDTDDWAGKEIVIGTELVTFQGKTGPAIRVKGKPPERTTRGNGNTHVVADRAGYQTSEIKQGDVPSDDIPFR